MPWQGMCRPQIGTYQKNQFFLCHSEIEEIGEVPIVNLGGIVNRRGPNSEPWGNSE